MKHFCCTLVFLHLPSILGRHLVNDAAGLDEKMSDDVLHTVARGLRSGDGVDMRMFDNLRLSSKRNGTSTVGERISSTADTWSQVREESAPAGVATSIESSLAVKESANTDHTDQDQDDEDYVETVPGTDYMDLDSPGHEQGGNWQSTPSRDSFQSTAVVPQYPGTKETQRHAVPMYSDPHASLSAWQPMSSLAQEVYVTSDGESNVYCMSRWYQSQRLVHTHRGTPNITSSLSVSPSKFSEKHNVRRFELHSQYPQRYNDYKAE